MKILAIIKKSLRPIKPFFLSQPVERSLEDKLGGVDCLICDSTPLNKISSSQVSDCLNSSVISAKWESINDIILNLHLPEMTGGVNPGDQRAIFYLISALKPQSILEIGTHVGCSTVHIVLALKSLPKKEFITVDIRDINDPQSQPWKEYGSESSPLELIKKLGGQDYTKFINSTSLDYFKTIQKKFDFIFLDGLHDAYMVYQEIPIALQHLNNNGVILLHDYFPDGEPLWKGYPAITGPYLAVKRLQGEGAKLKVLPLGNLPWPTKLGTSSTSLALLTKAH